MKKRIFTFWEPKDKIPPYLKLCLKTWEKFLPDYEIVILDYELTNEYLGENFFDKSLYKNFSLQKQTDAIRCAILNKFGGIWMDIDTIVTCPPPNESIFSQDSPFTLINQHIGFIISEKNSKITDLWLKLIKKRIHFYKKVYKNKYWGKICLKYLNKKLYNKLKKWNYMGNGILDIIFNKYKIPFNSINREEIFATPEINFNESYEDFYFKKDYSAEVFETTKGIILLHNSWTPEKFKEMSEEEFLNQDCTISKVLKQILSC